MAKEVHDNDHKVQHPAMFYIAEGCRRDCWWTGSAKLPGWGQYSSQMKCIHYLLASGIRCSPLWLWKSVCWTKEALCLNCSAPEREGEGRAGWGTWPLSSSLPITLPNHLFLHWVQCWGLYKATRHSESTADIWSLCLWSRRHRKLYWFRLLTLIMMTSRWSPWGGYLQCRIQWHVLALLHLEITEGAMAAATAWQGQGTKSFIPEKWWPLAPDQVEN